MIIVAKLLLAAATFFLLLAWLVRYRSRAAYDMRINVGLGLGLVLFLVMALWGSLVNWPLQPAFWLADLAGSARRAAILGFAQQALTVLAWLALAAGTVTDRLRMPVHRILLPAGGLLWTLAYVTGMFWYY